MSEDVGEKTLVDSAIGGDAVALQQLLLLHVDELERHIASRIPARARKHLGAEDLLQVVISQVFRDIHRFVPRGDRSFYAWLRAIADNRLLDALRKIDRGHLNQLSGANFSNSSFVNDLIDAHHHDSISASRAAADKESIQAVRVAIGGLPDGQRDVIWAACIEGKALEQIATETGRTIDAVRGLIHRGKANLRIAMGRSSRWFSNR